MNLEKWLSLRQKKPSLPSGVIIFDRTIKKRILHLKYSEELGRKSHSTKLDFTMLVNRPKAAEFIQESIFSDFLRFNGLIKAVYRLG